MDKSFPKKGPSIWLAFYMLPLSTHDRMPSTQFRLLSKCFFICIQTVIVDRTLLVWISWLDSSIVVLVVQHVLEIKTISLLNFLLYNSTQKHFYRFQIIKILYSDLYVITYDHKQKTPLKYSTDIKIGLVTFFSDSLN